MRAAWRVRGRVQGVGFRGFTRREARALGLAGWVRNRPDGTVEVQAEGQASALALLATRLGEGPRGARVDALTPSPPVAAALPPVFAIHYDG